jgi:hypothetical protein
MTRFRVLMTCQVEGCRREFRDISEYYEQQSEHEEEKRVKAK